MKNACLLLSFLISTFCIGQDAEKLIKAVLGETPILEDLHELCDEIGGRVTGTEPNEASVAWSVKKFKEAGVKVWTEKFEIPRRWSENSATATVTGASNWKPKIACRAFSTGTPSEGLTSELVFVGKGSTKEFENKRNEVNGNFVLIETPIMKDLTGLFLEYINAVEVESNAKKYGAKGVVYMSSRAKKLLYRHLTSYGIKNDMPMVVMARDDATRCKRLLKRGKSLNINLKIDVIDEGPYFSENVVAEIEGNTYKEDIIILGAHIDSWGLGTGANDNGCNSMLTLDIARQMIALNIKPKRTIRFVLWNGEEQGMLGSYAYTQQHKNELDKIKLKMTVDIGSGNIDGFFTNGRSELNAYIEKYIQPVDSLSTYENTDAVIVGTDNYDFFSQGIPNIVGKHDVYNYCADYHSESDTYDKVNQLNLKHNTAKLAALLIGFANMEEAWPFERKNREAIQADIDQYELQAGMEALNLWEGWQDKSRGISK